MSVLVVGSVALDTVKTPFGKEKEILGGSATFSSVSASVFCPVSLVAVVGRDFPEKYLKFFNDKGIDTNGLVIKEGKTFRWEGEYGWDFADPKTISTELNVFASFDPKLPKEYKNIKHVFLANIDPQIQEKVLKQVNKPKLVACDTMNYWIEKKKKELIKLLRKVDVFLVNESEAKEFTTEANLITAGKSLLKFGPKIIIIKKGEHGVLLFSQNHIFATPAFLLETVYDPTGAGDTFAGSFMGYLAKYRKYTKNHLRSAVVYASVMATFAVEDFSLKRLAGVTVSELNKRIKEFRKCTVF